MNIIHLNHSDISGGASRAAYRIHNMLIKNGINSSMWVDQKKSENNLVHGPTSKIMNFINSKRQHLRFPLNKLLNSNLYGMHSPSILPSTWVKKINKSDADIIHLHWVQGEMLSIKEIGEIKKPIIWSFHDMWPFCGCEHYAYNLRYSEGYKDSNRSKNEFKFFDINRWRWEQKVKLFNKPIQIISPSTWMTNCVKKSFLMKNWPIETIPHPIDISSWKPLEKGLSRKELNLPQNSKLIIFGALGGTQDIRKGFKLLELALNNYKKSIKINNADVVIFGGNKKKIYPKIDFKIHYFNEINSDTTLQKLYSAADVMIVPSKMETFGQTALEALACGTPVVAFNKTGVSDIVKHKENGFLAEFMNEKDLANGIDWILKNPDQKLLSRNSRKRVENYFSEKVIFEKFQNIYNKILINK